MKLPIIQVDHPHRYPPCVTEFTLRFWDSIARGSFETSLCADCSKFSFPPKKFCPHCWGTKIGWSQLCGRVTLHAQTLIHAAPAVFKEDVPYRVGIVDLQEGLRIATRILSDGTPALDIPVQIVTLLHTDGPLFAARA